MLNGYVEHIIVSFLDDYKNVIKNKYILNNKEITDNDYIEIGKYFSEVANKNGIIVQTCFEDKNLVEYGFIKEDCLSKTLAYLITLKTNFKKWTARKGKMCQ